MTPSDYEMIEQGYDPPRVTYPLEKENRRLRAALEEIATLSPSARARRTAERALAAEPVSGETYKSEFPK